MGYSPGYTLPQTSQYLTEQQDVTSSGGTAGSGSIATGVGFSTQVNMATTSLTTLASGTALTVLSAAGGPLSPSYFAAGTQTIDVQTNNGIAVLSYTGKTATTYTGIAIVSGTGSWTVTTGYGVWEQPLIIPDVVDGASIGRGDGGVLGTSDWFTLLSNTSNNLAGLLPQGTGFVLPVYSDGLYGGLQWATNSGTGVSTVTTGSPAVAANSGAGGALASSVLLGSTGAVAGDNKSFRRVMIFFQNQANGANVTFATTGGSGTTPVTQTISTAGSGLAVWDSGDLGYQSLGTGFTATAGTVSGGTAGGVVLVGALYIQSAGNNGVIGINLSKGGVYTGDLATTLTGMQNLLSLLATMGMPVRRFITGDQICNDQLNGVALATTTTNIATICAGVASASPTTQVVLVAPYNLGTAGTPGVGNTVYGQTWVPAIRQMAIAAKATFVDMWTRFGSVSSATGDTYGYSIDNLHFSIPPVAGGSLASFSGRNGQESIAEFFFEKLVVSADYAVSGTVQSGTAVDGKVVTNIGQGLSGFAIGPVTSWYKNANDTVPRVAVGDIIAGLGAPGIATGAGGSSAFDAFLLRSSAGVWTMGSSALIVGAITSGAIAATGAVTATTTMAANSFNRTVTTSTSNTLSVPVTTGILNWTPTATATCTIATTGAVDGQMIELRIYATETVSYTNTENSTVNAPTSTTGSSTLPQSVLFQFNGQTTKWRCIAVA